MNKNKDEVIFITEIVTGGSLKKSINKYNNRNFINQLKFIFFFNK